MSSEHEQKTNATPPLDKFHEIELEQVFTAMVSLQNLRVQLGTFFGTVTLTILGIAFSAQKAGLLFLAAAVFWLFIVLDGIQRATLAAYYCRGLQLEDRFAPHETDTFLSLMLRGPMSSKIREIADLSKDQVRSKMAYRSPRPVLSVFRFLLALGVSLIEIATGLLLWWVFGWSLF
jgi:uncharacterized membrane protein SpoIIM required for sporulation